MSNHDRACSPLYRRQILQVNIRWKALDEIYKIYMLLHRSDLNISENFRQFFFAFLAFFLQKNLKRFFVFAFLFQTFSRNELPGEAPPTRGRSVFKQRKKKKKIVRISRQITEKSDVFPFFNQICENKSEICRKF